MIFRFAFILSLLFKASLLSEIIETKCISELKAYVKPHTLILFDIDNTLIEPLQELGSDQWFDSEIIKYKKSGVNEKEALFRSLSEWIALQHITGVRLVEPQAKDLIEELQRKNINLMGLTTRSMEMVFCTYRQFSRLGIDLAKTAPYKEELFMKIDRPIFFQKGVLFTAAAHKGEAFTRFLSEIGYTPKSVVFINDKAKDLREVEEACKKRKIPFTGLRYGFLDEKVKRFKLLRE